MRACKRCRGQGYIEAQVVGNKGHVSGNGAFGALTLCPECKDVSRYSRQVRYRYAINPPEPCDVIPINRARERANGAL